MVVQKIKGSLLFNSGMLPFKTIFEGYLIANKQSKPAGNNSKVVQTIYTIFCNLSYLIESYLY